MSDTINGIVKFAKGLALNSSEKLLRKFNLKDENGNYTENAWEITKQILMEENKGKLIEVAKAKRDENKEEEDKK